MYTFNLISKMIVQEYSVVTEQAPSEIIIYLAQSIAQRVMTLFVTVASHMSSTLNQLSAKVPWKPAEDGPSTQVLIPTWKTQIQFLPRKPQQDLKFNKFLAGSF